MSLSSTWHWVWEPNAGQHNVGKGPNQTSFCVSVFCPFSIKQAYWSGHKSIENKRRERSLAQTRKERYCSPQVYSNRKGKPNGKTMGVIRCWGFFSCLVFVKFWLSQVNPTEYCTSLGISNPAEATWNFQRQFDKFTMGILVKVETN